VTKFSIGAAEFGQGTDSDFGEFISIVSGRSVVSGADRGENRLEFGLSGDGMIRVFWSPQGLHANFISTTNHDEVPPLMLRLSEEDRRVPARVLELKLRALRNLYAAVHLLTTERSKLVETALLTGTSSDFEALLEPDEYLYVECLAPGSWYITLWSKAKESYRSIIATVALVYERGRDATLRKLEAEARIKELEAETKEFELMTSKLDYGLGLLDRVASPEAKAALTQQIERDVSDLLQVKSTSPMAQSASKRLLQAPRADV
jgi:hypothetical protein